MVLLIGGRINPFDLSLRKTKLYFMEKKIKNQNTRVNIFESNFSVEL